MDLILFALYYWGRNPITMRETILKAYLMMAREQITKEDWKILKKNYDYLMEKYHAQET